MRPSTFNEGGYRISQSIGSCGSSLHWIDSRPVDITNCSSEEGVLIDRTTQPNINSELTDEAIQAFNTWTEAPSGPNHTFITLQFSNKIILTRVLVYCLILQDLKIREPKKFSLFSSTAESIYPTVEIEGIEDPAIMVLRTGSTNIRLKSGGDGGNNDNNNKNDNYASSNYEYRKYNLKIPRDGQIPLNFIRISMDFEGDNWIFVSEVEAYHMGQLSKSLVFLHNCVRLLILLIANHTVKFSADPTTSANSSMVVSVSTFTASSVMTAVSVSTQINSM